MLKSSDEEVERSIAKYHSRLELVRTVVPVITLVIQIVILYHLLSK